MDLTTTFAALIAAATPLPSEREIQEARARVRAADGQRIEQIAVADLVIVLAAAPPPALVTNRALHQDLLPEMITPATGGSDGVWI